MPESWPPGNGTEGAEDPLLDPSSRIRTEQQPWGSVTDTGSMQPIPEAVTWAERADAWSQRPAAPETPSGWQEPSRWSEVAATGRPAFPPEGVGWRSETAEWRSSTETARWRTTTEWRSSEGTSGWRSTTEAWQTGGNRDGRRPVETPTRQPAISGTAWPTPNQAQNQAHNQAPDEQPWSTTPGSATSGPAAGPGPAPAPPWQNESAAPSWRAEPATAPWQSEPAAPRSQSEQATPPWQSEPATPSWQSSRPAPPGPSPEQWQSTTTPTWQSAAPPAYQPQPEQAPPWQATAGAATAAPPWQAPAWQQEVPSFRQELQQPRQEPQPPQQSWQEAQQPRQEQPWQEARPSWQAPAEPARTPPPTAPEPSRSWQQAPAWQQPAEPTPTWQQPAGQPTWQQPEPTPTWQQQAEPTPTWQQPGEPTPTWQQRQQVPTEPPAPSWRTDSETRPARELDTRPAWQASASAPERTWDTPERGWTPPAAPPPAPPAAPSATVSPYPAGAWSGAAYDDGRHLVREDDRAAWRRDEGSRRVGRRRAAEPEDAHSAGTGWAAQSDADNWAGHTDTGAMPLYQDPTGREEGWRRSEPSESWRARRSRDEPDSGSWARDDEPRTDTGAWRGRQAQSAPSWRGADSAEDTAIWRSSREMEVASDPWERGAADTGVGDMGWQAASETGSRRAGPVPRSDTGGWAEPESRRLRRAAEPDDDDVRDDPRRGGTRGGDPRDVDPRDVDPRDVDPRDGHSRDGDSRGGGPRREAPEDRERPGPDTPTEVRRPPAEPGAWQREQAARGTASYREGHTEDWRRELAAQTGAMAADGEPQRFGTSDFPPFRPPSGGGSAPKGAVRAAGTARRAPAADPREDGRPREELLVGARSGGGDTGSWQGPPDTQWPPRGATGYQRSAGGVAGPYERRPVSTLPDPSGRRNLLDEPDEDFEEVTGGPLAAVGYTALWYGVPVVLFVLYMLVLDSTQQLHALSTLAGAAPQFGLSLALSMAVAVGLRWASGSWKAASVGLAAAVMGGGLATVLTSAITGNSLS
jgi:hypothetical protein